MRRHLQSTPRLFLLAMLTAVLLVAGWRSAAGDLLVRLVSAEVDPGEQIVLELVQVNSGKADEMADFPASFGAALLAGAERHAVNFLAEANVTSAVVIHPGAFATGRYSAAVPSGLRGRVWLEPSVSPGQSFVLELAEPEPGVPAEVRRARPVTLREGMDEQTEETSFFKRHFFPYEPFYFIAGPDSPNAKFQVSFKYRLVNSEVGEDGEPEGWLHRRAPWMDGLHMAYTQRSLWDLSAESAPFLDSSYMPELLYEYRDLVDPARGWLDRIGAQIGFQHESNGRDGLSSRSLNIAYLWMPFVFGDENAFHVAVEPRAWFYVGGLAENPDLRDFRGHVDLRAKLGWAKGLQVAGWLRAGHDFDNGSAQIDVTYPLHNLLSRSFSIYLQGQYFTGYGESLLLYNQRSETWRIGVGLYR